MKTHMFDKLLVTGKEAALVSGHMTYRDTVVLEKVVTDALSERMDMLKNTYGSFGENDRFDFTICLEAVFVAGFLQGMRQLRETQRMKCGSSARKWRNMELCKWEKALKEEEESCHE